MLILTVQNITKGGLKRPDGGADYDYWLGVNRTCIAKGTIRNHKRSEGAAKLLRLVADDVDRREGHDHGEDGQKG